jgi:L-alanine-DL-glutamate epimerase-like enolase superfamily enzyme
MLPTLALAGRAQERGIEVVVTSVLDSAAGLWPALQLAAALPDDRVHGLATSAWLARDLGAVPTPVAGRIALPHLPGSGFHPD